MYFSIVDTDLIDVRVAQLPVMEMGNLPCALADTVAHANLLCTVGR